MFTDSAYTFSKLSGVHQQWLSPSTSLADKFPLSTFASEIQSQLGRFGR